MSSIIKLLVYAAAFFFLTGTTRADISTIALTGQVAPGANASFSSLSKASINNSGEIVFLAGLSDGREGIFKLSQGQLILVVLSGQAVSGSSQLTFGMMGDPVINDTGAIAFIANLQGGQPQLQAAFIVMDAAITMVLDSNTPVPGIGDTISLIRNLQFNNNGDIAIHVTLSGAAGSGILLRTNGGISSLLPGAGTSFALNNASGVAFLGSDGNIRLYSNGTTQVIAQSGQSVPNTTLSLNTLRNPNLNDQEEVVFVNGTISPNGGFGGIFVPNAIVKWRNGSLEKVAFSGDSVSGFGTATLSQSFDSPLINNSGRVVFLSKLSTGNALAIFSSYDGNLDLLVQEGRMLNGVGKFSFIGKPATNNSGKLTFVSNMDSGVAGIFRLDLSSNEVYFPRVADGSYGNQWSWRTTLIISNRDTSGSASITVNFINEDGTPMDVEIRNITGNRFEFILPASGSLQVETAGVGDVRTGWARVLSDKRLSGISIFSYFDGAGNYVSEVGAPATSALNAFSLFVESGTDINTAIALTNPNASPAQATLTLRDDQGSSVGSPINLTVPDNGELTGYLTKLFQEIVPPDFHGTIEVESQLPIIGLNLRQRKDVFTWLPLIQ